VGKTEMGFYLYYHKEVGILDTPERRDCKKSTSLGVKGRIPFSL
jgi:hypothetical protein